MEPVQEGTEGQTMEKPAPWSSRLTPQQQSRQASVTVRGGSLRGVRFGEVAAL